MNVSCPGCPRHIRVGLAHVSGYFEELEGLRLLAGSRCAKKECHAQKRMLAMEAQLQRALLADHEDIEA